MSPSASSQSASKPKTEDKPQQRSQYRDKPDTGGSGFYKKDFPDRGSINRRVLVGGDRCCYYRLVAQGGRPSHYDNNNNNRRSDFNDRSGPKPYYNKPSAYGNNYGDSGNSNRGRDSFQRRDGGGRDNYNSQYDSRYSSTTRDRPVARSDYSDKMKYAGVQLIGRCH